MSRDIADRASRIRLDAQMDRPSDRTGWRHQDIRGWTAQHRERLLSAVLELVEVARQETQGWTREWTGARHGRYGRWSAIVGPVVAAAGLGDHHLASRAETLDLGDAEGGEWAALVTAWAERGGRPSGAAELATYCVEHELLSGLLGDTRTAPARMTRALAGMRDRVWTVEGVRWRLGRPDRRSQRPVYALEAMDDVPDMAARARRSWTDDRPLWPVDERR